MKKKKNATSSIQIIITLAVSPQNSTSILLNNKTNKSIKAEISAQRERLELHNFRSLISFCISSQLEYIRYWLMNSTDFLPFFHSLFSNKKSSAFHKNLLTSLILFRRYQIIKTLIANDNKILKNSIKSRRNIFSPPDLYSQ